jgi:transformation/transcription domain-associated protein
MLAAALKRIDRPITDGEISQLFFESAVRCLCVFELRDPAGDREFLDWMTGTLIDSDAHVFQELWTRKLDFFFNAVVKRAHLIHIMQILLTHEATSTALVSIVLRHFSDRLGELGEQEEQTAVTTIRIFKLAFSAVTTYPDTNEPVLARHLARFIMDSFPMAAKATHPTHYFHLIRALFRAIGSGAGRFELLYKEVLPLLPEMLESLNRQLMAADSLTKDLLVELCLTVPLRLTHLLPHLHYLMQPLVSALQGGPELVSQGLRTLELCIDNLTGEFLDPILKPVLRELMEALHSLLKPLPGSHHHAHTTIRILGKLGGRNRRLLDETPHLEYKDCSDTAATIAVSFSGRGEHVRIGPMARMAAKMLRGGIGNLGEGMAANAYQYLEQTLLVLMNEVCEGS